MYITDIYHITRNEAPSVAICTACLTTLSAMYPNIGLLDHYDRNAVTLLTFHLNILISILKSMLPSLVTLHVLV